MIGQRKTKLYLGFRNGSTKYEFIGNENPKDISSGLEGYAFKLPSHQPLPISTVASLSSFALKPSILPAQSAILLLCSAATHHVISTLPNNFRGLYFF